VLEVKPREEFTCNEERYHSKVATVRWWTVVEIMMTNRMKLDGSQLSFLSSVFSRMNPSFQSARGNRLTDLFFSSVGACTFRGY
jgi:hypothetical protein